MIEIEYAGEINASQLATTLPGIPLRIVHAEPALITVENEEDACAVRTALESYKYDPDWMPALKVTEDPIDVLAAKAAAGDLSASDQEQAITLLLERASE